MLSREGSFIKWNAEGVCFPVFVPERYLPGVLCGVFSCSVVMVLDCLHLPAFLFQVSCCLYTPTVCLCDVIFIYFLSLCDSVSFVVHPIHLPRWMRGCSVFFWKNHIPEFPSPSLSLSLLSFPQTWLLKTGWSSWVIAASLQSRLLMSTGCGTDALGGKGKLGGSQFPFTSSTDMRRRSGGLKSPLSLL